MSLNQKDLRLIIEKRAILIDEDQQVSRNNYVGSIASIAQLPAFQRDDKLTKLLYSKLLVKGVQPININRMKQTLLKNSKEKSIIKTTRQTTRCTKEIIVKQEHYMFDHFKTDERQVGIFQLSRDHPKMKVKENRPKSSFQRSNSSHNFSRPRSAIQSASLRNLNVPASVLHCSSSKSIRPQTAVSQSSASRNKIKSNFDFAQTNQKNLELLTITENSEIKKMDYIQKNKRSVSSRRKSSVYITAFQAKGNNLTKSISKVKEPKQQSQELIVTKNEGVTLKEKQRIKERQKQYINYMKQNMPYQYNECMEYLCSLNDSIEISKSIFDTGFGEDDTYQLTVKQQKDLQIQQFYQDYYNKCLDVQYGIKRAERKKQSIPEKQTILNIYQCEEIIANFKNISDLRQKGLSFTNFNEEIKRLVRNLQFFKDLKSEVLRNIFEIDYQIEQIDQSTSVIHERDEVKNVYIILNGSVTKQNMKNLQQLDERKDLPNFLTTLFDGEVFGIPNKTSEKVINYTIRTLEKCLFMTFPYPQYKKALTNNQNIEDSISLLKMVFADHKSSKVSKEDLQALAFQLDISTYSAQELIFREGQPCPKLLIVASGKVSIGFQSIITRAKSSNDLLKRRTTTKRDIKISQLRKNNLMNYQLIHQNAQQIQYYYFTIYEKKERGDALNWKGFNQSLGQRENTIKKELILPYSILSCQDHTKVYFVSADKFENLSDCLKQAILHKAQTASLLQNIVKNYNQLKKWEKFKENLSKGILKNKANKLY